MTDPTYAEVYAERWPTADQVEAETHGLAFRDRNRIRAEVDRAARARILEEDGWRRKRRPVGRAR